MDDDVIQCGFYWEMRRHVDSLCVEYADPDRPVDDLRRTARRYVDKARAVTVHGISDDLKHRVVDQVLADILKPGELPGDRPAISVGDWLAIEHEIVRRKGPLLVGKVIRVLPILESAPGFIVQPHSLPETRDPDADFAFIAWKYVFMAMRHTKDLLDPGLLSEHSEPATRELAGRALVELRDK